jgi:ABC-type transporter MlaC component
MSRSRDATREEQETFRTKVLKFLEEELKKGVLIKYDNAEVEVLLDPSADYDVMAKRVNDSVTITVYSRYATCTVKVRVNRNGEWRLRNVVCRGRR